ncbi:DNA glycosylase [Vararia minispora EC-137]|uniref:DNA glycosylase n=1 Tax=Vararia minispora EC-137 TaxID=1314806 RepID=A0ACB8QJB9_9AGAM|nr:DNA glycosylase [Vararia minispora EC-137]
MPAHSTSRHVIGEHRNAMQSALLVWFEGVRTARNMPWRKPFDGHATPAGRAQRAYEVWVSEIMLQQTQVATVIPYFNRWMESFPTVKDLAASDIDTVNQLWKGLGYYSRAARLLAGAKKVVEELGGRLPDNARDMQASMPGIGRYTAGAICSIAYNEQVPVLDGNVTRLLSRILALHAPPKAKATTEILWDGAEALVKDCDRAGELNQSLIELGSTVCKPRDPACGGCPVKAWCQAYRIAHNKPEADLADIEDGCTLCAPVPLEHAARAPPVTAYPMKTERKKQREELDMVHVVEWRRESERWFLLVRRPDAGLLAGLYEFPTQPNISVDEPAASAPHLLPLLAGLLIRVPDGLSAKAPKDAAGLRLAKTYSAGDVKHVFSHIIKTYRVVWAVLEGDEEGEGPPALKLEVQDPRENGGQGGKAKGKKGKVGPVKDASRKDGEETPPSAMWVRLADVEHANVGTGVMKIWKLVRALWDE